MQNKKQLNNEELNEVNGGRMLYQKIGNKETLKSQVNLKTNTGNKLGNTALNNKNKVSGDSGTM